MGKPSSLTLLLAVRQGWEVRGAWLCPTQRRRLTDRYLDPRCGFGEQMSVSQMSNIYISLRLNTFHSHYLLAFLAVAHPGTADALLL